MDGGWKGAGTIVDGCVNRFADGRVSRRRSKWVGGWGCRRRLDGGTDRKLGECLGVWSLEKWMKTR